MNKKHCLWAISFLLSTSLAHGTPRHQFPNDCSYISKNAYNNRASCAFIDREHRTAVVTPNTKISIKQAVEWLISTSIYLQLGGENRFDSITVLTSPDAMGESAESQSGGDYDVKHEPEKIKKHILICKSAGDWSDVIGKDGVARPRSCRPFK